MKFKNKGLQVFWDNPDAVSNAAIAVEIRNQLYRKLQMLDAAVSLQDLRVPPSNRLEKLSGKRTGQYSIRVNDQYRLCFVWNGFEALEVEYIDYH